MRLLALALTAACAAASPFLGAAPGLAAGDVVVDCETFRTRWVATAQAVDPGKPPLVLEKVARPRGTERITNAPGVDARMTCVEGKLTHVELHETALERSPSDPVAGPFLLIATATLVALQGDLTAEAAGRLVAALRAESASRDAATQWGPYEITFSRTVSGKPAEFIIDFPEN